MNEEVKAFLDHLNKTIKTVKSIKQEKILTVCHVDAEGGDCVFTCKDVQIRTKENLISELSDLKSLINGCKGIDENSLNICLDDDYLIYLSEVNAKFDSFTFMGITDVEEAFVRKSGMLANEFDIFGMIRENIDCWSENQE